MLFRSDRKSTRLNSSHTIISYAVFCLKKKPSTLRSQTAISPFLPQHVSPQHDECSRMHMQTECAVIEPWNALAPCSCAFFFYNQRPPTKSTPFPKPPFFQT